MGNVLKIFLIVCLGVTVYKVFTRHTDFAKAPGVIQAVRLEKGGKPGYVEVNPKQTHYLALYHGASWCPPCQAFSPTLAEFYRTADKSKFQLVMINYDRTRGAMIAYMLQHKMDFPAVQVGDAGAWGKSTGDGIPNLIIVDAGTGQIVASSFDGSEYLGPQAPLERLKSLIR